MLREKGGWRIESTYDNDEHAYYAFPPCPVRSEEEQNHGDGYGGDSEPKLGMFRVGIGGDDDKELDGEGEEEEEIELEERHVNLGSSQQPHKSRHRIILASHLI